MKILSHEEEKRHFGATLRGGVLGGAVGLTAGAGLLFAATRRYPVFNKLTLAMRGYMVCSCGTFGAVTTADRFSHRYEAQRNPGHEYHEQHKALEARIQSQKPVQVRIQEWAGANRYKLVFGSWVATLGTALHLVGRNPYLTGPQKLVQARVYAQGLTVAIVVIALALEGRTNPDVISSGALARQPTQMFTNQWKDMVEAEEERLQEYKKPLRTRLS